MKKYSDTRKKPAVEAQRRVSKPVFEYYKIVAINVENCGVRKMETIESAT